MKFNLQTHLYRKKTLRSELQTMIFFEEQIFSYPSLNDRCVQRVNLFNKKNINHSIYYTRGILVILVVLHIYSWYYARAYFYSLYSWYYARAYNELAGPISSSLCPRNTSH